jgi:hypothetical protein
MHTMMPDHTTDRRACRARLTRRPAAAAEARGQVRAAICAWDVPADDDAAVRLTCELVANAIKHTVSGAITPGIRRTRRQPRADVHDTSPSRPVPADLPADAEAGRGLALAASRPAGRGAHRTPAGKAVYVTLALQGPDHGP